MTLPYFRGERLISRLKNSKESELYNHLLELTNMLCYNSCVKKITDLYLGSKFDYKQIQRLLIKSNKYASVKTSFYYKNMGICYFYNGRKIAKIKELIEQYRNNKKDEKWRYYDVIISAYEDEVEMVLLDKLFIAFNVKYDIDEIINLILDIPEIEKKKMLYFVLFVLFYEKNHFKKGQIFLKKYMSKKEIDSIEPQLLEKLSERYDVDGLKSKLFTC